MNLGDRATLELNQLCDAAIEGTLTSAQKTRLEQLLAESDDARSAYVKAMDLSASLGHYASEMQMEPAERPSILARMSESKGIKLAALAAAVSVAFLVWMPNRSSNNPLPQGVDSMESVARLTGAKDIVWAADSPELVAGDLIRRGQQLDLAAGFAEITFDSGAVLLLEGPTRLDVNSAWDSTLRRGALKANVPKQAIGFRVANAAVEVIDLGTEFSIVASDRGSADVFVLKGEVEAMPRGGEDSETILLRTNESRRFARSDVSVTENTGQAIARFNAPISLERLNSAVKYVHWSFDDNEGSSIAAMADGFPVADFNLKLLAKSPIARRGAGVEGIHNRALRFNGKVSARADFPGLSSDSPRTVAFWVKVPKDAPLSAAYSMVAWRGDSEMLADRPVHIGWNRNPNEGPLGAVRTDFSGGHAMGTTPLRDNRWHHIAVIFLTSDDSESPVQVKQYVDGHLESNTVTLGEKRSVGGNIKVTNKSAGRDRLWLGCRLGGDGPRKERFLGEIDDLVVVDRGLEPAQIIELMEGYPEAIAK